MIVGIYLLFIFFNFHLILFSRESFIFFIVKILDY